MSHCKACGAAITWAITEASGRSIPLDPTPTAAGNLVIVDRTQADTPVVRVVMPGNGEAFMPHHATCPDVDKFRKKKRT